MTEAVRTRGGGLAAWSIHHPIGVVMIALAVMVLGAFSLSSLGIDLLPHIIYPEVRVRVLDSGIPAGVMEDRVTRQLEEQLAITEDAISVQSRTNEGRSSVDLAFPYGKDIDLALRDASTRLDRARRLLPDTVDPPIIFKRDPSQIPVLELVVNSPLKDAVELRTWADYEFSKWFLNLPGVAAVEVGGGLVREIQILPDPQRLHAFGLDVQDVIDALRQNNAETPLGRLRMPGQETSARLAGRFGSSSELAAIPLPSKRPDGHPLTLGEVAQIIEGHEDEKLRIRLNALPGLKISIQKQPQANTVTAVEAVYERLAWLQAQKLLPPDIQVATVSDQAVYVRNALSNAGYAALSGALLAMVVVWLFLGDLRRTLIIGSAIPLALMVTLALMSLGGLTLNLMSLGGLALGIGMLVDSAIVMLENISRHQQSWSQAPEESRLQTAPTPGESRLLTAPTYIDDAVTAASEINSAIVASTTTNLASILPFLFIGGLTGLLFRELIFTIAASTIAALLVAITLVPALAARVPAPPLSAPKPPNWALRAYLWSLRQSLRGWWLLLPLFVIALWLSVEVLRHGTQTFLPDMDEGRVSISVVADPGISLNLMDKLVEQLEVLLLSQPEVATVYAVIGGSVFGRSQTEATNRSSLDVQLRPPAERAVDSRGWLKKIQAKVDALNLVGVQVRMRVPGIRGIRLSQGDDDLSLRIQGDDLTVLTTLAGQALGRLKGIPGLRNLKHSAEEVEQELAIEVDRQRAADLGFKLDSIGSTLETVLRGRIVGYLILGDRQVDIRLRLSPGLLNNPHALADVLLYNDQRVAVRLGDLANLRWISVPAEIFRAQQRRAVEISATLDGSRALSEVLAEVNQRLAELPLPSGYIYDDGGSGKSLQDSQRVSAALLGLAVFLVFVVMAVQYESLRNPLIIILSVPFSITGVALAVFWLKLPLSMPVWLGLIMLAGMVVNNTIILVETIEQQREAGIAVRDAVLTAASLRLRPIFMTTLTTIIGMLPLALGWGEGGEMLQPLAVTIIFGMGFSVLVSLVLAPILYQMLGK